MTINLLLFFGLGFFFLWAYKRIKNEGIIWLAKLTLQIGILILFVGGFFKLFLNLPPNPYIKIIFSIIYIWFTVGINVNFMIPLIKLIDRNIGKNI